MLEDLGHEVLEANSGKRALEILRDVERVDLMITDYSMPKMNGMELATTARELRPDLPILLATGYAELPSGPAIDLPRIDKPYHQERLAAGIAMAVRSHAGGRRPRSCAAKRLFLQSAGELVAKAGPRPAAFAPFMAAALLAFRCSARAAADESQPPPWHQSTFVNSANRTITTTGTPRSQRIPALATMSSR